MNYDAEQTEAINTVGTNILVSASAGAGKTGVLVARLTKRVVNDRIRVSRILAMTFTQAAAAEMKKRLAGRLHEIYQTTQDTEEKEWVRKQLVELESASITTIDSYCLSIIQKYFSVIGLDPATAGNILSGGEVSILKQQAYSDALQNLIETDHDSALQLLEYFSARSEDFSSLADIVDSINNHAQSCINPETWYAEAAASYHHIDHLRDLSPEVRDAFFSSFRLSMNRILSSLTLMKEAVEDDPKIEIEDILPKENLAMNCMRALNEENWSSFCMSLENLAECKTKANGKNLDYTAARKKMDEEIKKLLSLRYDESIWIQDHNDLSQITETLVRLARDTWQNFMQRKQAGARMDFSDMERYAYNILQVNNGAVADLIRASFDEIMVDEFQDTSELQNEIIDCIAKPDNVFRVGDVKQSIYRFRQARPQLMRSLMSDENTKLINLRHNFRSQDSIVQFSNRLFARLMNVEGIRDCYSENDTVTVGREEQKEEEVPIEFALLMQNKDDENADGEESVGAKQNKAEWIARKMLRMKKEDPSLSFRSFAVLVRSHGDKAVLRAAFEKYGIPYDIDAREGFYSSALCQIILAMVRFMLKPADAISLLAILTSPFCSFTDEQLARLVIDHGKLMDGVRAEHPEIIAEMTELRDLGEKYGIIRLLSEIAYRHDFYNALTDSQKANFDYLFETVTNLHVDCLQDFLDIMEAGQDEKSSEAVSRGKDDDVVTVTTIHQSKGLQYPIVFLWSTSANRFNDGSSPVIIDDDLKLGIAHQTMPYRAKRPTLQRIAVEYRCNLDDIEEFTRLLYVAVTRAERRLFIVDSAKKEYIPQLCDLNLLSARSGMSGLILSAMHGDSLFRMNDIDLDVEKEEALPKKYVTELPHLSVTPEIMKPFITPSSTELSELAPLDGVSHIAGTRYGTHMHETAEKLPNRMWTMEDLAHTDLKDSDKERLLAFARSDLYQKALTMEIHKEYPFCVSTDSEYLTGSMDFLAIGENEIILVDFKTDHADPETIRRRYASQLNTYRRALQILYPAHSIQVYAWSFHHSIAIEI